MDEDQITQLEELASALDPARIEEAGEDRQLFLEGVRLLAEEDVEGMQRRACVADRAEEGMQRVALQRRA